MAKIDKNSIFENITGKLGNIVFRKSGEKTSVYILSPRSVPFSKNQEKFQQRFRTAVSMAKKALSNEEEREKFEKMALGKGKKAYNVAVSYFMKELKNAEGKSGDGVEESDQ